MKQQFVNCKKQINSMKNENTYLKWINFLMSDKYKKYFENREIIQTLKTQK